MIVFVIPKELDMAILAAAVADTLAEANRSFEARGLPVSIAICKI